MGHQSLYTGLILETHGKYTVGLYFTRQMNSWTILFNALLRFTADWSFMAR